jgi:hypothetical protein
MNSADFLDAPIGYMERRREYHLALRYGNP